ncbi:hypothetical protein [Dysgonomonas sp. 25]|uniref:hypothetical protein n=1 Tax=Dysgonomonas sp. 25 TaxID=2302933 RepID=UPI0013D75BE7|nr:hypothetical protein [Dysgonomonas sp. 25]NDV70334.1 hypothetical protein [Dysgonomonas sp. 25]
MQKTFNYYKGKGLFFILLIPFILFLLIFAAVGNILGYVMVALIFLFMLLLVHRFFIISITFDENKVVYKSLFKKIEYDYGDVKDIIVVEKERRAAPEFETYENNFSPSGGLGTSYFILIGDINYYPSNPYFLLTKPVDKDYITLQYRDSLKPFLELLQVMKDK